MMNFRKIAAASKGRLVLRYFTENTPEPIHPPALDAAGRQLEEGGRLTAYYTGRDSRAAWRPDMPAILARAIGIDPYLMPRDAEMARLFEGRRADNGEAWSPHKRKISGLDLVFSPHKSISLAAEFAADALRKCDALECRGPCQRPRHALRRPRARLGTQRAPAVRMAPIRGRSAGSASGTTPPGRRSRCRMGLEDKPTFSMRRSPATRICTSITS